MNIYSTSPDDLVAAIKYAQQRSGLRQHAGRAVCAVFLLDKLAYAKVCNEHSLMKVARILQTCNETCRTRLEN